MLKILLIIDKYRYLSIINVILNENIDLRKHSTIQLIQPQKIHCKYNEIKNIIEHTYERMYVRT